MSSDSLPPCRLLVRSKDGVELFSVSSDREAPPATHAADRTFLVKGSTTCQVMAPDGSCAYILVTGKGVVQCPLNTTTTTTPPIFLENSSTIQMLDISPKGSYLLTWQRATDEQPNNLKVWCAKTGQFLTGFPQKGLRREGWPYVQWTADEMYAFLMTTNEVRVYPGHCFKQQQQDARYVDKLRVPGMTSLSVPQSTTHDVLLSYRFTTFCPGDKNKPSKASLHEYSPTNSSDSNDGDNTNATNNFATLVGKSLFQAEEMKTHWSPTATTALITLQTSVDASGKSYYGSATLFLLGSQHKADDAIQVNLSQEGPVMDVSWCPKSQPPAFAVIAGRMPAMSSLHNGHTGEPLFLFGNAHRNTIAWAPHGRFLCLAGFGNLAGGMSFWDRNKCKLIPPTGQNTASCTVGYGWSPDSRLFGVSTTTPRMNVDNGIRFFRYNGEEVTDVPWKNEHYRPDKLLQAEFVPALPTVYPDRPQSPTLKQMTEESTTAAAPAAAAAKPAGRYIPPSQRGKQTAGSSLAERMRREKEAQMKGAQKVDTSKPKAAISVATGKVIPGLAAAPTAQEKSKSAMKREKQKLVKQRKEEEAKKLAEMEEQQKQAQASQAQEDPEKRGRKLKKTLKQIDDLKQKDPASLNEDQQKKVASEASIREELAQLGLS